MLIFWISLLFSYNKISFWERNSAVEQHVRLLVWFTKHRTVYAGLINWLTFPDYGDQLSFQKHQCYLRNANCKKLQCSMFDKYGHFVLGEREERRIKIVYFFSIILIHYWIFHQMLLLLSSLHFHLVVNRAMFFFAEANNSKFSITFLRYILLEHFFFSLFLSRLTHS